MSNNLITNVTKKISNKKYDAAKRVLKEYLSSALVLNASDEKHTYFRFENYIEVLLMYKYVNMDKSKKNIIPDIDMAQVYYLMGFVHGATNQFKEAEGYLEKALEFNPVRASILLEMAFIQYNLGYIEEAKQYIDYSYNFIYLREDMAVYYKELARIYMSQKKLELANALLSISLDYDENIETRALLDEIANMQDRVVYKNTTEEIKKILKENNIATTFSEETIQTFLDGYNELNGNEKYAYQFDTLSMTLYYMTLNERFLLYYDVVEDGTGIRITAPQSSKIIPREQYGKYNIFPESFVAFMMRDGRIISVINQGECSKENYSKKIEENKKIAEDAGLIIEYECETEDIKQFVARIVTKDRGEKRMFHSFKVINNQLFNMAWSIDEKQEIKSLVEKEINSERMRLVVSFREIDDVKKK